jgi:hypothetical protein
MPHNFSNCPLRSSCLLITNHSTQIIVTATDEILDLLGYKMTDIIGQSINTLLFKPLSKISSIPECTIKNSTGDIMTFQVCVHQDPLGGSTSLDYWLIRPVINDNSTVDSLLPPAISILKLSPYGTIEQVQLSSNLNQPITELIGRPVMAFIYGDDVKPLCSTLSKICSIHKYHTKLEEQDPLFIRWSRLPCLIANNPDLNNSLNYDWMSFTLSTTSSTSLIKPICIIRSLQVETSTDIIQQSDEYSLLGQLLNTLYDIMNESTVSSKVYIKEFYQHVVKNIMEIVTTILYYTQQKGYLKSNYLMQKSLDLLHLTGLLDPHCCTMENY